MPWEIFTYIREHMWVYIFKRRPIMYLFCITMYVYVYWHWWEPWELYKTWENINQNALFFTGEHEIRIHKFHIYIKLFFFISSRFEYKTLLFVAIHCVLVYLLLIIVPFNCHAMCVWEFCILFSGYLFHSKHT